MSLSDKIMWYDRLNSMGDLKMTHVKEFITKINQPLKDLAVEYRNGKIDIYEFNKKFDKIIKEEAGDKLTENST